LTAAHPASTAFAAASKDFLTQIPDNVKTGNFFVVYHAVILRLATFSGVEGFGATIAL